MAIRVSTMVGGEVNRLQGKAYDAEHTVYNPEFARELIAGANTALDNGE